VFPKVNIILHTKVAAFDLSGFLKPLNLGWHCWQTHVRNQLIEGVEMTAELIAQLATLFLILGAGPIIVVLLYARGGNL
jgi:hypothetical protein